MNSEEKEGKVPPYLEIANILPADIYKIMTCKRTYTVPIDEVKKLSPEAQAMLNSLGMINPDELTKPDAKQCKISVNERYHDVMYG